MNSFFITSPNTNSGKTFVTSLLCKQLRAQHHHIRALKPIISGFDAHTPQTSDSGILLQACGLEINDHTLDNISPWRFSAPISPHAAAEKENKSIHFDDVVAWTQNALQSEYDYHLVEGAGGIMSPITPHHTNRDWLRALNIPCMLVTSNYLGSISHTLTACESLFYANIPLQGVIINTPTDDIQSLFSTEDMQRTLYNFLPTQISIHMLPFAGKDFFSLQHSSISASYSLPIPDLTTLLRSN